MVSKCANPNCRTPFRYFRGGALFFFETNYSSEPPVGIEGLDIVHNQPHRLEHFWLCDNCSSNLVLRMVRGKVEVVPRRDAANRVVNMPAKEMNSLIGAENL
jgi:hypothetical protein